MNNEATTTAIGSQIDYLPREEVYRAERSPDESITTAVVLLVGTATGRDVMELPPLSEVIDVDALNDLFRNDGDGAPATLEFEYANCEITVTSDDEITLSYDE